MKNNIQILALIIAVITTASSCKKDDNSSSSSNSNTAFISAITSGSWRITYFHESGDDHTSNFNGYTFTFSSSGTMTATDSSGTVSGTWRMDDSNSNEFHMSIGNTSPLTDLDKGWLIISQSSTEIVLKDDDSTHNEELHFSKI